jgi:hypothetical protein
VTIDGGLEGWTDKDLETYIASFPIEDRVAALEEAAPPGNRRR